MAPVLSGLVPSAGATAPTITQTFGFNNDTLQYFTVPADVTSLTITAVGGQGSWGGNDSSGRPPAGGYQGQVTGTMSVTPGQYLTIAVGSGGDQSPNAPNCTAGQDASSPTDTNDAVAGISPLTQYNGGMGGAPGPNGCSGYGGSGGAATAVQVGSSSSAPTSVGTIVAGGGGGSGGSGQYALVKGQISLANYVPQSTPSPITYGSPAGCTTNCSSHTTIQSPSPLPTQTTQGQQGIAVFTQCGGSTNGSNSNQYFNASAPSGEAGCDGGGGAGGGGGAAGGAAGNDQFGSGSSDEWYGQGGSPGQNSTGGISGLVGSTVYYTDANAGAAGSGNTFRDPGATYDGEVIITYSSGVPGIPSGISGTAGDSSVALQWTAPNPGAQPITDYVIQYSSNGGSTWTTDDTSSTSTSATVSGLTNGTGYVFEVQAVNSIGNGPFTAPSGTLTPSGPPGAPTITSISPLDGALQVNFTPPSPSGSITGYQYQLNGTGSWYPIATTSSPLTISGLTDGTTYSVEIEAVAGGQSGSASNSVSGTPVAVPGAPTISVNQVGSTTASINAAPGNTGGSSITGYRFSTDGGATWTTTSTTSPLAVTGLSPGTTYTVKVEAGNGSGYGAASTTSFTTTATPSAPVITSVTPGNHSLTVSLTAPSSGGSPITNYDWSTDGGSTWHAEPSGTPCQVTGGTSVTCPVATLSTDGATPLTNGTSYPIEMKAVNSVGAGAPSNSVSGTPYTTPGAPTITTGSSGMIPSSQSLTVDFTAPTSNGGSAITAYQYSTDAGVTWHDRTDSASATSTTMTITALSSDGTTALTNGTTYNVEIRAVNVAGDGPGSDVATGIPVTAPSAPSITSVTSGDTALGVTFTPGSNGGSAITSYQYSTDGGTTWISTGSLSTTFTITALSTDGTTALANGTPYSVEVRAENGVSGGSLSSPSSPVSGTPATVPTQPVITAVPRGNATMSVSFTEAGDGGSAITSYQYSTDGGVTWQTASGTSSPLTITALSTNGTTPIANGTEYPVEIRAVNTVGDSLASSPVEAAPATVPGAPTVVLTPGNGVISVATTVTNDGGSAITGIDYSLDGTTWLSTGTTGSTFTITGLTNGTSQPVWVRADNAIGYGTPFGPASATPYTVPGPPINVQATNGAGSSVVSWSAPAWNGGSAVTQYTATAYTSSAGTTTAGTPCTTTSLTCSVTGLTNNTTYYLGVVATNAAGSGVSSSPLVPVTPVALPGAPTINSITPGNTILAVNFTAGSPGGDPITSYQYSLDGGTTWTTASGTTSPIYISGLTNGTSYPVRLVAVSAAGAGATSNSVSATPYAAPNAPDPTTITAVAQGAGVLVSWAAPASNGAPISNQTVNGVSNSAYTVTAFNSAVGGTQIGSCSTSGALSCALTGLPGNATYYVSIQAGNAAGLSPRSSPRVAVSLPGITSAALGGGDVNVAYSGSPVATGGTAPLVWSVSTGSLPAGLSLNTTTGAVTGTPTATGTSNFTLQVTDANNFVATQAESIVIASAPTISSAALGGGDLNVAYTGTPSVSGGTGAYVWSVSTGSLPAGLSLNTSTGAVTGTPTATGTTAFTLKVVDSYGLQATQSESMTIVNVPAFTSSPLGNGEVGVSYSAAPAAAGGTGSFTWSVSSGSLPAGLTLNTSTGAVTGTPTASGSPSFTLKVTDSRGGFATQAQSFSVVANPTITSAALSGGEVGEPYAVTPTATGGTAPLTWSVSTGSLPAGLTLNPSTGAVTGTPTASGSFTFSLQVTDANNKFATQPESLSITAAPTITTPSLPSGDVGVTYSTTPTVTGGTAPFSWAVVGSLPAGLSITSSTGAITGTPTTPGSVTFTLQVTDHNGVSATHVESIAVADAVAITSSPAGAGEVGVAYSFSPVVIDGVGPYVWSLSTGSLPVGLTLNPATGAVSGIPTTAGPASFTLQVVDTVNGSTTQSESLVIAADPTITSAPLSGGEVGEPYAATPTTTGGTAPLTWSVTGGSLPAGLTLHPSSGAVNGTPTASGPFSFTLTVTDAHAMVATQLESFSIATAPTITSVALAGGEVTVPYAAAPTVAGGTPSYSWSTSAPLPAGLSINPSTGALTGTPTTAGTYTFTLVAVDSVGVHATQSETVTVAALPSAAGGGMVSGDVGVSVGHQLTTQGGTGPYAWNLSTGSLPSGVVLSVSGVISGVPANAGTFVVTVTVTDAHGLVSSEPLTMVVEPTSLNSRRMAVTPDGRGYWITTVGGAVTAYGDAPSLGSMAGHHLNQPIVGIEATPDGRGYWLVASDGGVFAFGDAPYFGSEGNHHLNQPIVGLAATPDGSGYWLVASDGGLFTFGTAQFLGSEGSHHLNQPVVGMAATPDGRGYWLVASDGGLFTFGNARFFGSEGSHHLNQPIVGLAATPDGQGYWMAAADGGVFTFGDAPFEGSQAGHRLNAPIESIEGTQSGQGYWLLAADGGVFAFGGAAFMGSLPEA